MGDNSYANQNIDQNVSLQMNEMKNLNTPIFTVNGQQKLMNMNNSNNFSF